MTVTTNVPGPRETLFCLGRPLVEILPYVPIASTVRIGVAIFSYRDRVTFGITGDYDERPISRSWLTALRTLSRRC